MLCFSDHIGNQLPEPQSWAEIQVPPSTSRPKSNAHHYFLLFSLLTLVSLTFYLKQCSAPCTTYCSGSEKPYLICLELAIDPKISSSIFVEGQFFST